MGLFKKPRKSWVDDIEEYSNFTIGLKMATDNIIDAAVRGDDDLCEKLWVEMTTEQRQYGYWFMLGIIAEYFSAESYE